jgi:hypothetical protein
LFDFVVHVTHVFHTPRLMAEAFCRRSGTVVMVPVRDERQTVCAARVGVARSEAARRGTRALNQVFSARGISDPPSVSPGG